MGGRQKGVYWQMSRKVQTMDLGLSTMVEGTGKAELEDFWIPAFRLKQLRRNMKTTTTTKFIDPLLGVRVSARSLSLIPTPVLGEAERD